MKEVDLVMSVLEKMRESIEEEIKEVEGLMEGGEE